MAIKTYPAGLPKGLTVFDPNLIPANILSGKSIFGVVGSAIQGKRYANGGTTSSASTSAFQYAGSTSTAGWYSLTVSGLSFIPSTIIAIASGGYLTVVQPMSDGYYSGKNAKMFTYSGTTGSATVVNFKADVSPAVMAQGTFTIPVQVQSTQYSWWVYE